MDNKPIDSVKFENTIITKGTELYHARIIPRVGMCYVQTLKVRTIYENSIVGIDSTTKNAQVINISDFNITVFLHRKQADKLVKETQKSGLIKSFKNEGEDI